MRLSLSTAALACVLGLAFPSDVRAATAADLQWLAGCWALRGGEPGTVEHWLAPAGGSLLGVSRTVKNGRTVEYEFMRIQETEPGQLAFVADPSGQAEAAFALVSLTATEVVFENRTHDFPQRIIYRRAGALLEARIEGTLNGETRSVNFPMDPVSCSEPTDR